MHYVFNPDHYIGVVIANTTLLYKCTHGKCTDEKCFGDDIVCPKRVRRLLKERLIHEDENINAIAKSCKHIQFLQLNIKIFKSLKKLKR